jgi:hypothetical protein
MMRLPYLSSLIFALSIIVNPVFAQQTLGSLVGTVADSSGAVIADADVALVSDQTGLTRTQKSRSDGGYSFNDLQIGTYTVTFGHDGFETDKHPAVGVQGNRTTTLDVKLVTGSNATTVTVNSSPSLNKTDTTNGYVLESAQIEQIPLGTGSFTQLATLTPGVNADFLTGAGSNDGLGNQSIFSNGQRDTSNSFSFNGVNTNNLFNGKSTSAVAANRFVLSTGESFGPGGSIQTNTSVYDAIGEAIPSAPPEFLQELRVNAANYDASQGQNSGAHIEQVVKSGGNQLHGAAYGYRHTDWLDAAPFFRKRDSSIVQNGGQYVPRLHRFTVGGTLGGPIIKDRLFFFAAYQYERVSDQANGQQTSTVPLGLTDDRSVAGIIAAENSYSNENGPTAPLTPNQLDPAAVQLMQFKLPNGKYIFPSAQISDPDAASAAGFDSLVDGGSSLFRSDRAALSLDYTVNRKDSLTGRYYYQNDPTETPFTSQANTLGFPQQLQAGSHVFSLINTATLSPNIVYDQRVGFIREVAYATTTQQVSPSAVGIDLLGFKSFPGIIINTSDNILGNSLNIGPTTPFSNAGMYQTQYEVSGNLNWLFGKHNVALGYNYDYTQLNIINRATSVASITFDTFTDFVTGNVKPGLGNSQIFQGSSNRYYRAPQAGVYINDKFNITHKFAITAGIRWDYDGGITEKYGRLVNFDSARYGYTDATDTITSDGLLVAGNNKQFHTSGTSNSTLDGRQWGFAPRVGLIYSVKENLVVRAGFGLYYDRGEFFSYFSPGAGNGYNGPFGVTLQPPFVLPTAATTGATLSQPFNQLSPVTGDPATFAALLPNTNQLETFNYPAGNQFGPYLFAGYDIHNKLPYSENWNFDVQWQPRDSWTADIAYTGNHGLHLVTPVPFNQAGIATSANPIHGQSFSYGYQVDGVAAEEFNTSTGGNTDLRVPFIGYSPNSVLYKAAAVSHYDALQTNLTHRMQNGLQFTVSYTYSHTLDEQSGLGLFYNGNDPTNLASGYGNADFDRTHVLVADYYYEFPKLTREHSVLGKIANGWAWSGIATLQSGQPYNVYDFSGSVAGIYYGTNDFISNPIIPFAPGYTPGKAKTGHSGAFPGQPAIDYKAFVVPVLTAGTSQANQYGVPGPDPSGSADNSETIFGPPGGRNVFRGAFQKRADMSMVKLTKLTDRYQLRYSFDVFNVTNTPSFDTPDNNVEFNPDFDGNYVTVPRGQLGVVQHTIGSPRFISMSLRFGF